MTDASIRWVAELLHARDVTLRGGADLGYWKERLAPQGLEPAARDGRAEVMIMAVEGRFRGVRFRELSFSVAADVPGGPPARPGAYLVHAYNSSRFFAWCERTFFSTPYSAGAVSVSLGDRASVGLRLGGRPVFRAAMAAARPAVPGADGGWEGVVHLPPSRRAGDRAFFARLRGTTTTCPFDAASDALEISPVPAAPVLAALRDSHFVPAEWQIRPDSTHAKSKTYSRRRALQRA
jgi:hypothetical protein